MNNLIRSLALLIAFIAPAQAANQAAIQVPTSGPMSATTLTNDFLNPSLLAVFTNNWGATPPANGPGAAPAFGQSWLDTSVSPTANTLKIYDGSQWLSHLRFNSSAHTLDLLSTSAIVGGTAHSNAITRLTVNANTSTLPDWVNGAGELWIAQISGPDGVPMVLGLDSFGNANTGAFSTLDFRRARGTLASKAALQQFDYIGVIGALGYKGDAYSCGAAQINFLTAENWAPGANGSMITFATTQNGQNACGTTTKVVKIDQSGFVAMGPIGPGLFPGAAAVPNARLHLSNNPTWTVPNDLGAVLQMVAVDGSPSGAVVNGFGNLAFITLRRAANTAAAPGQVLANTIIGAITGQAYTSSPGYTPGNSQLQFIATQNQTTSNQGQAVALFGTPDNTNTTAEQMRAQNGVSVGLTAQPGFGIVNALNGYQVNGVGVPTLGAANLFTNLNTITTIGEGLRIRSGSVASGSFSNLNIGRTSNEADFTVAANSNDTLPGTLAGDLAIRAVNSLFLGAGAGGGSLTGIKIAITGLLTFPQYTAGVLQSSAGGAITSAALPTTSLSGTLQAAQEPAHTGDVTNIAGSLALAIGATKVTSAMLNSDVFSTAHSWPGAQTFTAPALGTPASGVATNITGLPISTGLVGAGSGVLTWMATPSSANFAAAITDEAGVGLVAFTTEGAWTPALSTDATPGTPAYSIQVGSYERIGRQVTARFQIIASGWTGSPTGNLLVTGLPLTSTATTNDVGGCSVTAYAVTGLAASTTGIFGFIGNSTTSINFRSGGNAATSVITAAQAGTAPILFGICHYRV